MWAQPSTAAEQGSTDEEGDIAQDDSAAAAEVGTDGGT